MFKKKFVIGFVFVEIIAFCWSSAFAGTPQKINYQGKLQESGAAVSGDKTVDCYQVGSETYKKT